MDAVEHDGRRSAADIVSGLGGLALNVFRSVTEFADRRRTAEAGWRFDVDVGLEKNTDPYRNARIQWNIDRTLPVDIKSVAIKRGERIELVPAGTFSAPDEPPLNLYPRTDRGSSMLIEADLYKSDVEHGGAAVDAWFFVLVPTRSQDATTDVTALYVTITYEEVFGRRRQRKIVLKSGNMLWATRNPSEAAGSAKK